MGWEAPPGTEGAPAYAEPHGIPHRLVWVLPTSHLQAPGKWGLFHSLSLSRGFFIGKCYRPNYVPAKPSSEVLTPRWLDGIIDSMEVSLSKLREVVKVWRVAVCGVAKIQTRLSDWTTKNLLWYLRTWLYLEIITFKRSLSEMRSFFWVLIQWRCPYKKEEIWEDPLGGRCWPSASQGERPQKKPTLLPSWIQGLQNCEATKFCCWSPPVCDTLTWQPQQTNTGSH